MLWFFYVRDEDSGIMKVFKDGEDETFLFLFFKIYVSFLFVNIKNM